MCQFPLARFGCGCIAEGMPDTGWEKRISDLEAEIQSVKDRNRRVQADKAWETSRTRTVGLLLLTYIMTAIVFYNIGVERFMANALVPTVAFYLSRLSLPFLKAAWLRRYSGG
jgi:hypothetical protein